MKGKYSAKKVAEAIVASHGILAQAATMLGCTRQTVYSYIKKYPTVKAAHEEAREVMLDTTEGKLYEAVTGGNLGAIIFTLKTIGAHRGFVERREYSGPGGGPIQTKSEVTEIKSLDLDKLKFDTVEDLYRSMQEREKIDDQSAS